VSKKDNSVWRLYYYDVDEYDNTLKFYTKKINPLLVGYYKLKPRFVKLEVITAYITNIVTKF